MIKPNLVTICFEYCHHRRISQWYRISREVWAGAVEDSWRMKKRPIAENHQHLDRPSFVVRFGSGWNSGRERGSNCWAWRAWRSVRIRWSLHGIIWNSVPPALDSTNEAWTTVWKNQRIIPKTDRLNIWCSEGMSLYMGSFWIYGSFPGMLQNVWESIYSGCFPSSEYEIVGGPEIVWNESPDIANPKNRSEIWVPVKKRTKSWIWITSRIKIVSQCSTKLLYQAASCDKIYAISNQSTRLGGTQDDIRFGLQTDYSSKNEAHVSAVPCFKADRPICPISHPNLSAPHSSF